MQILGDILVLYKEQNKTEKKERKPNKNKARKNEVPYETVILTFALLKKEGNRRLPGIS